MKAIWDFHWPKRIRKAVAWGKCATKILFVLELEKPCVKARIVAWMYLHGKQHHHLFLCLWWSWSDCRHLFWHKVMRIWHPVMHLPSGCSFPDLFQSTHMHIMLSTFAYIPLASDLIVVGGGWWRGLCKSTSARLCAKNARGLTREWERICGTLRY